MIATTNYDWLVDNIVLILGVLLVAYVGKAYVANVSEAARERWTRRADAAARISQLLSPAERALRLALSPNVARDEIPDLMARARDTGREFDNYVAAHTLFLPRDIRDTAMRIADEMMRLWYRAEMRTPDSLRATGGTSSHEDREEYNAYWKVRTEYHARLDEDGVIGREIAQLERDLRGLVGSDK